MNKSEVKRILILETTNVPLTKIDFDRTQIINPTTKQPYDKGMILEGIFADLSPNVNRNNRIYDVDEYLEHLKIFRKQVLSPKGIYGELEHPQGYMVNYNNVSHKILDVWYEPETMLVKGIILIVDTPKGRIAQEIVQSGGLISMSARAAGTEAANPDGSVTAKLKLLATYDIVCNSGFIGADMSYKHNLNESYNPFQKREPSIAIIRFGDKYKSKYSKYTQLCESVGFDGNFIDFLNEDNQSKQRQKHQEAVIEKNDPSDETEKETKLKVAVQKDLKQAQLAAYIDNSNDAIAKHKKSQNYTAFKRFNASVYDGAAGFVANYTNLSQVEEEARNKKKRKK
jgi:hypothetical protein